MTLTDEITLLMTRYRFSEQEAMDWLRFQEKEAEFTAKEEKTP